MVDITTWMNDFLQKLYRELCLEFEENPEIMSQTNNQKKTI